MSAHSSRRTFVKLLLGGAAAAMLPLPRNAKASQHRVPQGMQAVRHSTFVMGQVATITAYGADKQLLDVAITEAFNALRRVDNLMSVFSDASDIGKINLAAGREEISVDPWTIDAVQQAIYFSEQTHGVFDPTVEPLMRVWGFREKRMLQPSDKEIFATLSAVGVRHIKISPTSPSGPQSPPEPSGLRGHSGQLGHAERIASLSLDSTKSKIDLGGIGVGFAVDRAAECLRARGVECALIDVSGDLFAIGAPPESNGWRIGIVDPLHTASTITSCTIRDQALCTSGNYESFVEYNARKFGHIMNTRDGYPAHALASATVIAPNAITADALSKPAFIDPDFTISDGKIIRVMNDGELKA